MWHRYGIFSLKGHETKLGGGEKDFSMLFTYACADNYLKDEGVPFYSMYNISNLSFAKYRVTWKRMASKMNAVVISSMRTDFGTKKLISTDTTSFFAVNDKDEAHYLCAILNSEIIDDFIKSFSSAGRGFGAPSVMNNLAIPKFNPDNKIHMKLAELSEEAHNLVKKGKPAEHFENEIDDLVRKLWNIE